MAAEASPPRDPGPETAPPTPTPKAPERPIKARKSRLFAEDERASSAGDGPRARRRFGNYLRETPAAPLPSGTKALLWGVGLLVAVLLLATLLRGRSGGRSRAARRSRADAAAIRPIMPDGKWQMTNGKLLTADS